MSKEKTKGQQLQEQLLHKQKSAADTNSFEDAAQFCKGYKQFLDVAKTEREAVREAVRQLCKAGYTEYEPAAQYKAGDKVYRVNRDRALMAATIGTKGLEEGARLSIAHVDSPRMDLKPNPLYEAEGVSYFQTHYYGGVRKYQWAAIPLSMHGVVVKRDGEVVEVALGEKEGEPVFSITDLLPHFSGEQNKRPLNEGIKGEELNIVVGSLPFEDEEVQGRVKLKTMQLLNEKFGITEQDFFRAEIEFVPAFKAADVGFDASMIGAYGQDDRVCAYTALCAEMETKAPAYTTVLVLCDKEEIGSDGAGGLAGEYVFHFLQDLCAMQGANYRRMCEKSFCVSADVNAAFDPTFAFAFEKDNTARLNNGVIVTKYTGSGGKYGTSDAPAETMAFITNLFEDKGVVWQPSEFGKVDGGGGGTIAKFVANRNIDVVDVGVPVLSMHAPFELTAKLDVYNTYLAFKAFADS